MKYQIEYSRTAQKTLMKMPRNTAELIRQKIWEVADNPAQARNVKALHHEIAGYRLRVGDWRVFFDLVNGAPRVLAVIAIRPRGGAYK